MKSLIIKHTELTEMDNKIISMIAHEEIIKEMNASKLATIIRYRAISKWFTVESLNHLKASPVLEIYNYAYSQGIISKCTLKRLTNELVDRNILYSNEQENFQEQMIEIFYSILEKWQQVLIYEEFFKLSMFAYD